MADGQPICLAGGAFFLGALGIFAAVSLAGGFVQDGTLLIITRLLKGIAAAFTAPAPLSLLTTSFPEGPARNKALSIFTATGASGFSLGLVFGGLLTDLGWRWVFFAPAPVALAVLIGGYRFLRKDSGIRGKLRDFDMPGAISITAAMLLLVFTLVEAPSAGWLSARTLVSFAGVGLLLAAFIAREQRTKSPLVRLGILRSGALVRANLAAMCLFGGWIGFQFIAVLYMQQLRGWSALATGLAIFPVGLLVVLSSVNLPRLIAKFSVPRLVVGGLAILAVGYALFIATGLNSSYASVLLPVFLLTGVGFGMAYGPLNVAGTSGIAHEEQGLAGGLLNTSYQFGGALILAVVTAVIGVSAGEGSTPQAALQSFHTAVLVPVAVSILGVLAMARRQRKASQAQSADDMQLALARGEEAL